MDTRSSILDKISFYCLAATMSLLPVFFLPLLEIPVNISKTFLLSVGILLSLSFWAAARLIDGNFNIPKSSLLLSALVIVAVFLVSALFSPVHSISLWGQEFELGTFSSILFLFLLMFLSSIFVQDKSRGSYLFLGILAVPILIFAFQIPRLFLNPNILSFGLFPEKAITLVGSWNDLAIFLGFELFLSLIILELIPIKRPAVNFFLYLISFLAVIFLAVIDFFPVWLILGALSLFLFVYSLSYLRIRDKKFPLIPFIMVLVCLFFILTRGFVGGALSSKLKILNVDIRPSVSSTFKVAKETLIKDPVLGSGPGRFSGQWSLHKPTAVNESGFWNVNFTQGFGSVPTFLVTTGILGGLAWLLFFFFFLRSGIKSVFLRNRDQVLIPFILGSFLAALYLWIFSVIYVPKITNLALAFAITGIFIGLLAKRKLIPTLGCDFSGRRAIKAIVVLVLTLMIVFSISGGYFLFRKFYSVAYFQKGSLILRDSAQFDSVSLDQTENNLRKAVQFNKNDLYYRALSEIYLFKLALLVRKADASQTEIQTALQTIFNEAQESAQLASLKDSSNYQNFVALARVYENIVPLGVEGAGDNALRFYQLALKFAPANPDLFLALARVEIGAGNLSQARVYLGQALAVKSNYSGAAALLAQIEAQINSERSELEVQEKMEE